MTSRGRTLLAAVLLLVGMVIGGSYLTVPYVALGPGPVTDTLGNESDAAGSPPLISVSGAQTYSSAGKLQLTTVSVKPELDLLQAVRAWFSGDRAVVPRELVYPPDRSEKEVDEQNTQDMTDSRVKARTAALAELHQLDVVVKEVVAGGPSQGRLQRGDVITSVDGQAVSSSSDVRADVSGHQPGQQVAVAFRRGQQARTTTITTAAAPDGSRAVIGVGLESTPKGSLSVEIHELTGVGGPSAGMMFALGVIDRLTSDDLTGGRVISGTGTIEEDGTVGPIGGVQLKLIAARRSGSEYFLTPASNCTEAAAAVPAGLHLVKVATLHEAVTALRALAAGRTDLPAC